MRTLIEILAGLGHRPARRAADPRARRTVRRARRGGHAVRRGPCDSPKVPGEGVAVLTLAA